jgi:hypothetical protein
MYLLVARINHRWTALAETGARVKLHVQLELTNVGHLTPGGGDDTLPAAGTWLPGEAPIRM